MERVMAELANYFCEKDKLEVHLVLYGRHPEIFYQLSQQIIIHQPKTIFNNNLRFIYSLGRLYYLRQIVKKIKPKSILSFGEYWNSFVLIALFNLTYPIFISDRCSPEKKFSKIHTYLRKRLYPRAKGIIAQTNKSKDAYLAQSKQTNIKVIGNPIRKFQSQSENEKENVVLNVGRLIHTKHQDKLIELFLKINMPGWKLVVIGYDHLQQRNSEQLRSIIANNFAEDKVYLEGKKTNVEDYYSRSKIFAFTSSSEGFPNAIGEAMSAGVPVVAFDCIAGPSEMIQDNFNGFLIPLFDYEQFSEKLEMLMRNDDLRKNLGEQAGKDIQRFSVEYIGEKYLDFLLE